MKYKVGQKVKVREDLKEAPYRSEEGKYITVIPEMLRHNGRTHVVTGIQASFGAYFLDGNNYYWTADMLEPVCNKKIVITTDGVITTAREYEGKRIIKEAKAICSDKDPFDFEIGCGIAVSRLIGDAIPKESTPLYNGKVICVNSHDSPLYQTGKIYEFVNGNLTENGVPLLCMPADVNIMSLKDWQRHSTAEWLEVIE